MSVARQSYLLFYDYVEDVAERRAPLRPAHLEAIHDAQARGEIIIAGAFGDPIRGGAFVFRGDDLASVERFVEADPYVRAGLVRSWRIEPYAVVTD